MKDIILPAPLRNASISLMDAITKRRSGREFSDREIDLQVLSDLLWIAWGRNRRRGRTAPSSHNSQEVSLYVFLASGIYVYDTDENLLRCVQEGDARHLAGHQDFVPKAPLNIVYVADLSLLEGKDERSAAETAYADTGFIAQNVYLACVAYGLSCVIRASVNREDMAAQLNFPSNKIVTLGQTIGYPDENAVRR